MRTAMDTVRRRLTAEGRESGLTLVELLTTMVLLGMVGSLVMGLVMTTYDLTNRDRLQGDNVNTAATGMNNLSMMIRAGSEIERVGTVTRPIFNEAQPERMDLYSWIGDEPMRVVFSIREAPDGVRELVETRYAAISGSGPNWQFSSSGATRLLARHVPETTAGQDPLFAYVNHLGAQMTADASSSENHRRQIRSVVINLRVQTDPTEDAIPAVLVNQVGLPNVNAVRRGTSEEP